MTTCTRVLEFDAGHRLMKHEGRCRFVHGHRYRMDITCEARSLDDVGRVIDFGKIKEVVGGWLDEHLDHGFIAQEGDPIIDFLKGQSSKFFIVPFSPTAENLAEMVLNRSRELLHPYGVQVVQVRCYETPNGFATAVP